MSRKSAVISLPLRGARQRRGRSPRVGGRRHRTTRTRANPVGSDYVPGELLVRFDTARAGARAESARQAVATVGGRVARSFDRVAPGLQRVVLDEGVDVEDAAAELNARGDVVYAEPNYRIHAAGIPNDSRFGEQYGLHNTGQPIRASPAPPTPTSTPRRRGTSPPAARTSSSP